MIPTDSVGNQLKEKQFVILNLGGGIVMPAVVEFIKEASMLTTGRGEVQDVSELGKVMFKIPYQILFSHQKRALDNVWVLQKSPQIEELLRKATKSE